MKCEWCSRSFDPYKADGVCPYCGGPYEVVARPSNTYSRSEQSAQNINPRTVVPPKKKARPLIGLILVGIVATVIFANPGSETTESVTVPVMEEPEEKEYDIPIKFSHIVPTEALMEGDTVIGLPDGQSGAVTIIPDGAKHIADFAFEDSSMMAVIFPESLESIGDFAFYDCYDLEYAKLPSGLKSVGDYAFLEAGDEDETIDFGEVPSSLESVGSYAFTRWTVHSLPSTLQVGEGSFDYSEYSAGADENGIIILGDVLIKFNGTSKNVTIPDGVVMIDAFSFAFNEAVETVVMPQSVELIGNGAFYGATALQTVVFSPSITEIGNSVFEGCEELQGAPLPEGLLHIGDDVFVGCDNMHELHIPSTLITASRDSFDGCTWYYDNYIGGLDQWIFGDDILAALYTTYQADVIYLPDGIKRVGKNALFLTYEHEEIVFPQGVEVIAAGAISAMSYDGQLILDLPDSVTEIQGRIVSGGYFSGGQYNGAQVVIRCSPDSYAFTYAQEMGFEIIPR